MAAAFPSATGMKPAGSKTTRAGPRSCIHVTPRPRGRAVVDEFNKLPEHNRFIPGLRNWLGFKQASVAYDRQGRASGSPKQTLSRLVKYALDGMFSFSNGPLRAATYSGFIVSGVAFLLAVYYFVTFFAFHKQAGSGFTTIILCVLFLGGVQLISIGILGEYIGRIYEEVKQRPLYVVRERVGFGPPNETEKASDENRIKYGRL